MSINQYGRWSSERTPSIQGNNTDDPKWRNYQNHHFSHRWVSMFSFAWCFGHKEPRCDKQWYIPSSVNDHLSKIWKSDAHCVTGFSKFTFASFVIRFVPSLGTFLKAFTGDRILNISACIAVCGQRCTARGSSTSYIINNRQKFTQEDDIKQTLFSVDIWSLII